MKVYLRKSFSGKYTWARSLMKVYLREKPHVISRKQEKGIDIYLVRPVKL
jgi:hypothetical protein